MEVLAVMFNELAFMVALVVSIENSSDFAMIDLAP
jgi:hypothetical protein